MEQRHGGTADGGYRDVGTVEEGRRRARKRNPQMCPRRVTRRMPVAGSSRELDGQAPATCHEAQRVRRGARPKHIRMLQDHRGARNGAPGRSLTTLRCRETAYIRTYVRTYVRVGKCLEKRKRGTDHGLGGVRRRMRREQK